MGIRSITRPQSRGLTIASNSRGPVDDNSTRWMACPHAFATPSSRHSTTWAAATCWAKKASSVFVLPAGTRYAPCRLAPGRGNRLMAAAGWHLARERRRPGYRGKCPPRATCPSAAEPATPPYGAACRQGSAVYFPVIQPNAFPGRDDHGDGAMLRQMNLPRGITMAASASSAPFNSTTAPCWSTMPHTATFSDTMPSVSGLSPPVL